MEYLNENIDNMKSLNKIKGNVSNELDNYRSIQYNQSVQTLIVDKGSFPTFNRNNRTQTNFPDDSQTLDRSNYSQNQTPSVLENTFIQTITGLGKRLKQILTPKQDDSTIAPRKFSDIKILHNETTEQGCTEPLSERPRIKSNLLFEKNSSKYGSVSNSLEISSSSRSKDLDHAVHNNGKPFEVLKPSEFLQASTGRFGDSISDLQSSITSNNGQTENPFNAVKLAFYPPKKDFKHHKRNSSLNYEHFDFLATFRKSQPSYFEQNLQGKENDLLVTENDEYTSTSLTLEELKESKDKRKGMLLTNKGFSIPNKSNYLASKGLTVNEPLKKILSVTDKKGPNYNFSGVNKTNNSNKTTTTK